MHSYKTITHTNNNFITFAFAIITAPLQFITHTNDPEKALKCVWIISLSLAMLSVIIVFFNHKQVLNQ